MGIRKDTTNRRMLFRTCHICGQTLALTADTPFMRQMTNVNGKKQTTVYFCSESCKRASYKHPGWWDGKAEQRRQERQEKRDWSAKFRRYYAEHAEQCREKKRKYYAEHREECIAANRYSRQKRKLLEAKREVV